MKSIALLAIMLALGAALAGCLGDDDVETDDTETTVATEDTTSDNATATEDEEPADIANTPPTAELSADVDEGEAPLLVIFTITGEDADDDELGWSLDADGDGEADATGDTTPGEYEHNFTIAGNYSAVLNLSDGTDSIERVLNITVAEAGPPAVVPEEMVFTGTIQVGVQHPVDGTYEGLGNPTDRAFDFTENRTAVSKLTLTLEVSEGGIDTMLAVTAPDGTELTADGDTITIEDLDLLHQEGGWTGHVRVNLGVRVDYTLTASFE